MDPGGGLNRELKQDVAHCGWAEFEFVGEANTQVDVMPGWECTRAVELTAEECFDHYIAGTLTGRWEWFALEEWRLYPEQADRHVGSDFPTVQLIGALKHAHRLGARKARDEGRTEEVLKMQPASVKEPTLAVLRKRGLQSVAVAAGAGGHAKDAETHGWAYLLKPEGSRRGARRGR